MGLPTLLLFGILFVIGCGGDGNADPLPDPAWVSTAPEVQPTADGYQATATFSGDASLIRHFECQLWERRFDDSYLAWRSIVESPSSGNGGAIACPIFLGTWTLHQGTQENDSSPMFRKTANGNVQVQIVGKSGTGAQILWETIVSADSDVDFTVYGTFREYRSFALDYYTEAFPIVTLTASDQWIPATIARYGNGDGELVPQSNAFDPSLPIRVKFNPETSAANWEVRIFMVSRLGTRGISVTRELTPR